MTLKFHILLKPRYLMLILVRDKVFMLDRDNSVFVVNNLQFPKRKEVDKHLQKTLLDGVSHI